MAMLQVFDWFDVVGEIKQNELEGLECDDDDESKHVSTIGMDWLNFYPRHTRERVPENTTGSLQV